MKNNKVNNVLTSVDYYDVIGIYFGTDEMMLPKDICMMCLEYAGRCGNGRTSMFFWVYF